MYSNVRMLLNIETEHKQINKSFITKYDIFLNKMKYLPWGERKETSTSATGVKFNLKHFFILCFSSSVHSLFSSKENLGNTFTWDYLITTWTWKSD